MMRIFYLAILFLISFSQNAQCWMSLSAGGWSTAALKADSTLWTWGDNSFGQIGSLTYTNTDIPHQVGTAHWRQVVAGEFHVLGIKNDGTLWAWGDNNYGQIGDGTVFGSHLFPTQIGTDNDWKIVAASFGHSLALKNNGTLWAWGNNSNTQLGDFSSADKYSPVQIGTDTDWMQISAGFAHSMALKTDSTLWMWGDDQYGQRGTGTSPYNWIPTKIGNDSDWSMVSGGQYHSLALKSNGTLWAWGKNTEGQLGDGTNTNTNVPTQIGSYTDWKKIEAGANHSLGIKNNGFLFAWGLNSSSQLGDGTTQNSNVPIAIGANHWQQVSGGGFSLSYSHSLGITDVVGHGFSWGSNWHSALGNGSPSTQSTPNFISGLCIITKIMESSMNGTFVFPNPVRDKLFIELNSNEIKSLTITNSIGQKLIELNTIQKDTELDLSSFSSGLYILTIQSGDGVSSKKIIKE